MKKSISLSRWRERARVVIEFPPHLNPLPGGERKNQRSYFLPNLSGKLFLRD